MSKYASFKCDAMTLHAALYRVSNHPLAADCDFPFEFTLSSRLLSMLPAILMCQPAVAQALGSIKDGLPAVRSCRISFHRQQSDKEALLFLNVDSFRCQRDSLQELTLRGVGSGIRMVGQSVGFAELRALRFVTIHNFGLTGLAWLKTGCFAPVHALNLDGNKALELSGGATAALLAMTALARLSMRKQCTGGHGNVASGAARDAKAPPREAVWTADSVHCLTKLAAARPGLQLCF